MNKLSVATTNTEKFAIANYTCSKFGIPLEQVFLDIDEIQGEDPVAIVIDKAKRAYEAFGKPIVVSDDSWDIPALNGFPGPYMKSMISWFSSDDFLRLMKGVKDRRVYIQQYLGYHDGQDTTVFNKDIPGTILEEPKGNNLKAPIMNVVTMDMDNGKSLTEVHEKEDKFLADRIKKQPNAWTDLAKWWLAQN